jgi:quercetin 2,3-dioxygenase
MKTIKSVHKAISSPIADLVTYNALPGNSLSLDALNPFIFLNHHGPQVYPPDNNGLPFAPHPHRGIETVTFILDGDIKHKDSGGDENIITAGGVQWMSAGRGLIHMETCSDDFLKNGGNFEVLQLWVNLPAKFKLKEPAYTGLQKENIPVVYLDDDKVTMNLLSGKWGNIQGPFKTVTDVFLSTINIKAGGTAALDAPAGENILLYLVKGNVKINSQDVSAFNIVVFNHEETNIEIKSTTDSIIIFGHAAPLNEPVAAQGPFVMNTDKELAEAFKDYRSGKFGEWKE